MSGEFRVIADRLLCGYGSVATPAEIAPKENVNATDTILLLVFFSPSKFVSFDESIDCRFDLYLIF